MSEKRDHEAAFAFFSESSFCKPEWMPFPSFWFEHAPFAFWLNAVHLPRCLVELGTSDGFSYMVFCQGVKNIHTGAKCYAVGSGGDVSAAFCGGIFKEVQEHNLRHYAEFSTVIESASLQVWDQFSEGSIDLLHIVGKQGREAFARDWASWRSKMSDRGILLFHSPDADPGGARLWKELAATHPHFAFPHGDGLGVVGVGKDSAPALDKFFALQTDPVTAGLVRWGYSRLGEAVSLAARLHETEARLDRVLSVSAKSLQQQVLLTKEEIYRIQREQVASHKQIHLLENLLLTTESARAADREVLEGKIAESGRRHEELQGECGTLREENGQLQDSNRDLLEGTEVLHGKNEELQGRNRELQAALDEMEVWQKSWFRRATGRWHRSQKEHHPHVLVRWARSLQKRLPGHRPGEVK